MPAAGSYRKLVRNLRSDAMKLAVYVKSAKTMHTEVVVHGKGSRDRTFHYVGVVIAGDLYNLRVSKNTFDKCVESGVEVQYPEANRT